MQKKVPTLCIYNTSKSSATSNPKNASDYNKMYPLQEYSTFETIHTFSIQIGMSAVRFYQDVVCRYAGGARGHQQANYAANEENLRQKKLTAQKR